MILYRNCKSQKMTSVGFSEAGSHLCFVDALQTQADNNLLLNTQSESNTDQSQASSQREQVYNTAEKSPLAPKAPAPLFQHISACAVIISVRRGSTQTARGVLSDFCQCVVKSPGHLDYKL